MTETLDSLRVSIPKDQIVALERYTWPGNVRELRHVIERAVRSSESGGRGAAEREKETPRIWGPPGIRGKRGRHRSRGTAVGYSDEVVARCDIAVNAPGFVRKPYSPDALVRQIRILLASE